MSSLVVPIWGLARISRFQLFSATLRDGPVTANRNRPGGRGSHDRTPHIEETKNPHFAGWKRRNRGDCGSEMALGYPNRVLYVKLPDFWPTFPRWVTPVEGRWLPLQETLGDRRPGRGFDSSQLPLQTD